jgi:hypothetical protein
MYATVAEMIVVIGRLVVIVTGRVSGTVYLVGMLVQVGRRRVDVLRRSLEPGKHHSGEDSNDHGSVHGSRYSGSNRAKSSK